ncbi:MAG: hypothetical protein GY745_05325 [Actinomycetia bacterium]|nr:hypothetical protein [Actinomycetes bacterium]MCP3910728.1 hypothetical protein [Actinomycetes bacterium]MCP4084458.1 hypothetical protein [Actinomycetes bacterium]
MTRPDQPPANQRTPLLAVAVAVFVLVVTADPGALSVGHTAGLTVSPEKLTIDVVGNPP